MAQSSKIIIVLLFAGAVAVVLWTAFFWPVQDGSPSAPPTENTPPSGADASQAPLGLVLAEPRSGERVSSPLRVRGEIRGDGWIAFEGQAGTVELLDEQGVRLGFAPLEATADWMRPEVPFEATLEFAAPENPQSGTLVLRNENPSGLPERERIFRLPVFLSPGTAGSAFVPPLDRPGERVTKKPFGILITPEHSPVQPERFAGYHVGTDFEVFPEELSRDVIVRAVCDGALVLKRQADGYGGVAVQRCELEGKPITVVYGHLELSSIGVDSGEELKRGDRLGLLGADKSTETDGERQHLHLGFHWGAATDIRGYVGDRRLLSDWLDPCQYVCEE